MFEIWHLFIFHAIWHTNYVGEMIQITNILSITQHIIQNNNNYNFKAPCNANKKGMCKSVEPKLRELHFYVIF